MHGCSVLCPVWLPYWPEQFRALSICSPVLVPNNLRNAVKISYKRKYLAALIICGDAIFHPYISQYNTKIFYCELLKKIRYITVAVCSTIIILF